MNMSVFFSFAASSAEGWRTVLTPDTSSQQTVPQISDVSFYIFTTSHKLLSFKLIDIIILFMLLLCCYNI